MAWCRARKARIMAGPPLNHEFPWCTPTLVLKQVTLRTRMWGGVDRHHNRSALPGMIVDGLLCGERSAYFGVWKCALADGAGDDGAHSRARVSLALCVPAECPRDRGSTVNTSVDTQKRAARLLARRCRSSAAFCERASGAAVE